MNYMLTEYKAKGIEKFYLWFDRNQESVLIGYLRYGKDFSYSEMRCQCVKEINRTLKLFYFSKCINPNL